jgi:hypothetical protein
MNRLGENVGTHRLVLLASPAIIRSAVSSSSSSAPVRLNATLEITPASNLRPVAPLLSMRNQDDQPAAYRRLPGAVEVLARPLQPDPAVD